MAAGDPVGDRRPSEWASSPVRIGLASVVLAVPLAVLDGATGPYDDPKAWALPILVAATIVAWLAQMRDTRSIWPAAPDRLGRALRCIVLGCALWSVVATLTSVAPGLSLFGNFGRGMGLLSTGAAIALFFVVQAACRARQAVRDLVDAALLGSAPICLLAIGQAAGWDPLPRAWDPAVADLSVRSTFGQHIPLGGYLAILIPLAGARLETSWRQWRAAPADRPSDGPGDRINARVTLDVRVRILLRVWIPVVAGTVWILGTLAIVGLAARWPAAWCALVPWGVAGAIARATVPRPAEEAAPRPLTLALLGALLVLQLAVLVLSRARGPLLGLLLGVAVAGFVLLVRRRAWKGLVAGALAAALLAGGLVLLNVPGSPLAPLARIPLLQRLSELTNVERRNPVSFRLQVWDGVIRSWADQLRGNEIIPGTSPLLRSVLGYGLETELIALDPMAKRSLGHPRAGREGRTVYYLVDRAHNALLEQLMRGGLVGAGLWLALVPILLIAGFLRVRESGSEEETSLRLGGIGAIVAHLAEVQVGLATPTSLALFWITAAWVTQARWVTTPEPSEPPGARPRWWRAAIATAAVLAMLTAWGTTQWLLASMAYARGAVLGIAGRAEEASAAFERSHALMPWLPLPAQAIAQTKLQLAATEADPARRGRLLGEAEAALAGVRRHAQPGAADWSLRAQIGFAQVRSGDREKLEASLEAFAHATKLSPRNPDILAQWGWARLYAGDPAGGRRAAEEALAISSERSQNHWLAWAVLALAARQLGDRAAEEQASQMARKLAPPAARRGPNAVMP